MTNKKKKAAIHFGAGNIGRGLMAPLYKMNDVYVFFIDVNSDLLDQLLKKEQYKIIYNDKTSQILTKDDFGIIKDINKIKSLKNNFEFEYISTSCGSKNFSKIIENIKLILNMFDNSSKINIISFENDNRATSILKNMLNIDGPNYIDTLVDRIVPIVNLDNPLDIFAENYFEIVLDKTQKNNCKLNKGFLWVEKFEPYFYRKFWIINTTHLMLGNLYKDKAKYTYELVENNFKYCKEVKNMLEIFFKNILIVLQNEYEFNITELNKYVEDNMKRIFDKTIKDEISRLRRDPIKKLRRDERIFSLYFKFKKYNIDTSYLDKTIYLMLTSYDEWDEQSREIREMVEKMGIKKALQKISLLDDEELKEIISAN